MTSTAPGNRTIAIIRVSQVNGRDAEDGFASPDEQRERIRELCGREKLNLVGKPLEEMDVSGGKALDLRPKLLAAIQAVEAGRADVIVVAYFDRLVRSLEVQTQVLDRVEAAGGRVFAADIGEVSNATAGKWLSATMLGMVAEYHNRITAEKAGAAQRRAIDNGIPPMILPPGLRRTGGTVELDPELQPVVAEAVRMRAHGATVAAVREHLGANGIKRSYHGTTSLLKSRLLVGEIVFGENRKRPEDVWRGTVPEVVDRAMWDRAQRVSVPRGPKAKSDRLLARLGVLRCASCGSRMVVGSANHSRYFIYRCPPTGDCPRRVTISAEVAETVVVEAVRAGLEGTVGRRAAQDNIRQARGALQRAQDELDSAIRTLAEFADEPAAAERLRELRNTRDEARRQVDQLGAPDEGAWLFLDDDWDDLSPDDQRRCIRATLDRVMVHPAKRRGQDPRERIEPVLHDAFERLTGQTPRLPTDVA